MCVYGNVCVCVCVKERELNSKSERGRIGEFFVLTDLLRMTILFFENVIASYLTVV